MVARADGQEAVDDRAAGDRRETPQVAAPAFVGRGRELAALRQALTEPAVVLVEGEAGVGKSRLVREFLAMTPGSRRFAVGACPPFRESPTLGPIVEALRHSVDSVAGLPLSPLAGALRPLFPEWADQLPLAPEPLIEPSTAQHRLFRALAELICELGVTVLVAEDVHWADTATLEFMLFLVSRQPQPVSVIVTYRPEDVSAESLLLRLSSRLPATTSQLRVHVPPLDSTATDTLVSSMLDGQPVSVELSRFLYQHTDGVPLALEESVRLLRDRAELVCQEHGWARRNGAALPVPPTVRDAVLERVQRLDEAAHRVLQACSVLAEPVDESVVIAVAGLSGERIRQGLTDAVGCGLLDEDTQARLGFRHVLPRRAVYEAVPAVERRRLHLRAGQALASAQPPPLLQLTRHFRAADDAQQWRRYAEQAAAQATATGDYGTAALVLSDLLSGAGLALPVKVRLARDLTSATLWRRDVVDDLHQGVVRMLRELLDTGELEPAEDAELRGGLGRLLAQRGNLEAARAELERAVPNLGHDPARAARAMAFLGLPFIGSRPGAVHLQWLQRAGAIDTDALTPVERLALTVDRASGLLALGEESGWTVVAQIPTSATSVDERLHVTRGHLNVGTLATVWGYYADARRRLAAAWELADADRYQRLRDRIRVAIARLDWYTGAWDGLAERLAALTVGGGDDPVAYLIEMRQGLVSLAQGATRSGEQRCRQALDLARRTGAVDDLLEPAAAVGRSRLAADDVEEALKVTHDPMRVVATKGVWVWATDIAPVRVQALLAAGAEDEAAALVSRFEGGMQGREAPAAAAALATCHAWLASGRGQHARAAGLFGAAATAWERLPRPYEGLLAREQEARSLLADGQTANGIDALAAAHQDMSTLGARNDAGRVAELLHEHGTDTRRRRGRRGYGGELSPRELEVVRLLVTGATNREIASALSRSPKTVAGQLSSAMRKLEVSSRTALAVAAVDTGLVPDDGFVD